MSRLPDYCECSKPNSQKHCRIACGKPHWQNTMSDEEIDTLTSKYKAWYERDFFDHPNFPSWIYKKKDKGDG